MGPKTHENRWKWNTVAGELTKESASHSLTESELYLLYLQTLAREWSGNGQTGITRSTGGSYLDKSSLGTFLKTLCEKSEKLLIMSRNQLRIMTGLLTGSCHLKRHLFKMGLMNSAKRDRWKQASETAQHILCDCAALATLIFWHLARHFMKPGDFVKTSMSVSLFNVRECWMNYLKVNTKDRSRSKCLDHSVLCIFTLFYCILTIILCVGCSVISKVPWSQKLNEN
jgi:hypothetical protein